MYVKFVLLLHNIVFVVRYLSLFTCADIYVLLYTCIYIYIYIYIYMSFYDQLILFKFRK